ncbi:MAG: caspase family protein [Chitinophagaceae bacterium]|nr:caspase family protein [Chitinophagaceae bacterium]
MQKFIALLVLIIVCSTVHSQTKRAFVVGINSYSPPANTSIPLDNRLLFADLEGARNDATAFATVLTNRFHFPVSNIYYVFDRNATRDSLFIGLENLLSNSDTNDIAVFFYAGHGSQVKNSLSAEQDQKDETIVPADAWKRDGMDITDKELNKIFNRFIDKKVKLTVIFDCCHAGSLSRANNFNRSRSRSVAIAMDDRMDKSIVSAPEKRSGENFIILSAAQDNEFAVEQVDENNISHGSFTSALLKAINSHSIQTSAANIFTSTRAILKMNGKRQEPVIAGSLSRQQQPLFGTNKDAESEKLLIPLTLISRNRVELQAGFANGIQKNNELLSAAPDSILLRVDTVLSLTKAIATVIKGDGSKLKGGELFEIVNWVSSGPIRLKIYTGTTDFSFADRSKLLDMLAQLRKSLGNQWVNNPEKQDADVFIRFTKSGCILIDNKGQMEIKGYNPASILKAIGRRSVSVNVPLPSSANEHLSIQLQTKTGIAIVDRPHDADYVLLGLIDKQQQLAYSFLRVDANATDSLSSMPTITKAIKLLNETKLEEFSNSLVLQVRKLAKIKGWLTLAGPIDSKQFPFHLELRNVKNGKRLDSAFAQLNDEAGLHLVLNANAKNLSIPAKYIYSFSLDRNGTITLIYPDPETGNVENKMPRYKGRSIEQDVLLRTFTIAEPVGTDTYFLIACDEPIQNYAILLNQEGTRNMFTSSPSNPIAELLNLGNEGESRGLKKTGNNWSLLKMSVQSRH